MFLKKRDEIVKMANSEAVYIQLKRIKDNLTLFGLGGGGGQNNPSEGFC